MKFAAAALLALLCSQPALAADIQVRISGIRSANGFLLVDLHNQPAAFPEHPSAAFRKVRVKAAPSVSFTIRDVPAGVYAISYIHDENGNGEMDNNALGIPLEGFGFSRDPAVKLRAPTFSEAAFNANNTGAVVSTRIRYML